MSGFPGRLAVLGPLGDLPHYYADDPAPVVAELVMRHRYAVPGLKPAALTTSTHTFDGAYVTTDLPNGRQRSGELLDVFCRCGREMMKATPADVRAGVVPTCTAESCGGGVAEVSSSKVEAIQLARRRSARRAARAARPLPSAPTRTKATTTRALSPQVAAGPRRDRRLKDFDMRKFWSRVSVSASGCWLWGGSRNKNGYGQMSVRCPWPTNERRVTTIQAHRIAYEMLVGPIPTGCEIDHLCRVHSCVNPAHLEPVSHMENVQRHLDFVHGRSTADRHIELEAALVEDHWSDCGVVA